MSFNRNKSLAKNTIILFTRQLIVLFVSLYTVRALLDQLGIVDFGIYSAVGGLIALGAFLPYSLGQGTQRFFAYAIGEKNDEQLKKTFSVNLVIYVLLALIALILLHTIGLWFVKHQLSLPPDRSEAALRLYRYSALAFPVAIFTSPFIAIIMAHEDMSIYAILSIFETSLKLCAVISLNYLTSEKLEYFGLLILIVSLFTAIFYVSTCLYRYRECQLRKLYWDTNLFRDIVKFTGWTIFGSMATTARTHAITILLNQSFNPAVVASRAISVQISSQVNIFATNFNTSLYPPIIKSFANRDYEEMYRLVMNGSKFTFFLFWVFALPLIVEMEALLNIWLNNLPKDVVLFSQLALVEAVIASISMPLRAAAQAPGKMKSYELSLGSVQIGIFLVAFVVLSSGGAAFSVYIIAIVANLLMFCIRLYLVRQLTGFPVNAFLRNTTVPVVKIVLLSLLPVLVLKLIVHDGFHETILVAITSLLLSSTAMYFIGLDKDSRAKVKNVLLVRLLQRGKI